MLPSNLSEQEIQERATGLLRRFFGYSSFRPLQLEIITDAVKGHDLTVLMPTGGGKSLCYQIPALLGSGFTIVVSPLLSLMKDQTEALLACGIPAASVNSLQSEDINDDILRKLAGGKIKVLYISPERLLMEIDRWNRDLPIDLIAIDEAHCISQWGHDFRPVYTQLSKIKEVFPEVPVMALTATADRLTRDDISAQLRLTNHKSYIGSFDRPNLSLKVMVNPGKTQKLNIITSLIDKYRFGAGVVYCMSRKGAEAMNKELTDRGYKSAVYHAGLSADERNRTQGMFSADRLQVVCATIAFGMGIDKSNIRWVVHNNLPKNIESYYQEIGRAGRDGAKSETVMFYSYSDIITLQSFIEDSGQKSINAEKLERIKSYAESNVCRRRVLLSYFNEIMTHDCGNCDVCTNPPVRFDGKIVAQKALSAVVRTGQKVGITMLIDILRGMSGSELVSKGYHLIKTYGVGRDMSFGQWNHYISQLIQLGMLEIAYEEHNHLRVTSYGVKVLKDEAEVSLAKYVQPASAASRKGRKSGRQEEPRHLSTDDLLRINLVKAREELAKKEGIAPYLVVNDLVLESIVRLKPRDMEAFASIEGIGERRVIKYWKKFVGEVRKALGIHSSVASQGATVKETLWLLEKNFSPVEIADIKGVKTGTIYGHIAELIDNDRFNDFPRVISRNNYLKVMDEYQKNPDQAAENLKDEIEYGLVKIALSISKYLLRHK
ncbi:MAG: DNA helicase RecQ [Bacteroides sp.]|nr:DNA helicase RecQ [Bacteroides sp.]